MYICPECRSYFKTGSSGKKIKCLRCNNAYLTDLKIADTEWRKLDGDARKSRINRAIAGEHLRVPVPVPAEPVKPEVPAPAPQEEPKAEKHVKSKEDLPDEAILEAQMLLEEQDMQSDKPKEPIDKRRLAIVLGVTGGLLLILSILSLVVPLFRVRDEVPVLRTAQAGDVVSFGKYKGNTEWSVLERDNSGIVMVGNFPVANAIPEDTRNRASQIDWLNSSFLNRSFNLYERRKLIPLEDDSKELIRIMSESDWSKYYGTIDIEDDGKVHPVCKIGIGNL